MSKVLGISKNNIEVFDHPESHLHFDGDLLSEVIGKVNLEGTFHPLETIDMGRIIGEDHLIETDKWSPVLHMARPARYDENGDVVSIRPGESRMTFEPAEPTRFISIGLCVCDEENDPNGLNGKWCIFTVFEGKPGEREPWDRAFADGKNPEGLQKAIEFWEGTESSPAHALSMTKQEREYFKQKIKEDNEFFRKVYTEAPHVLRELAMEDTVDDREGMKCVSCVDQIVSDTIDCENVSSWYALTNIYQEAYDHYLENPDRVEAYYYQ